LISAINPFSFPILEFVPPHANELVETVRKNANFLQSSDSNGGVLSDGWSEGKRASSVDDYSSGGYTSFYSRRIMDMPEFEGIHNAAVEAFQAYCSVIGRGDEAFYLQHSWVSVYGKGHFVPEHIHTFSHLSCVFYAAANENTGNIVFKNPALPIYGMCQDQHASLFCDVQKLPPKVGSFYVFPSFMPHYTEKHEAEDKRVIFSSNAALTKSYLGKHLWGQHKER
jgi:uncharacterized protein (TIGR02466 family)